MEIPEAGTKVRSTVVLGAWEEDRPTPGRFDYDVPVGCVGELVEEWPTEPGIPWVLVRFVLPDGTTVDSPLALGAHAEVVT